jgi:hypothetical protein
MNSVTLFCTEFEASQGGELDVFENIIEQQQQTTNKQTNNNNRQQTIKKKKKRTKDGWIVDLHDKN